MLATGMKLSFGGQETAEIALTTTEAGSEIMGRFADLVAGNHRDPEPATA